MILSRSNSGLDRALKDVYRKKKIDSDQWSQDKPDLSIFEVCVTGDNF